MVAVGRWRFNTQTMFTKCHAGLIPSCGLMLNAFPVCLLLVHEYKIFILNKMILFG